MKRSKSHATLVGGTPDKVGPGLYEAVQRVDLLQLMNCWSEDEDRVWFLLGQGPMTGDGPIRASFVSIFINASLQVLAQHVLKVPPLASSVHHLLESGEVITQYGAWQAYVIDNNVNLTTPQGWRMVAAHACPGTPKHAFDAVSSPLVLH